MEQAQKNFNTGNNWERNESFESASQPNVNKEMRAIDLLSLQPSDRYYGPFGFDARGGSTPSGWGVSKEGLSFSGSSTSDEPLIFGITVERVPNASANQ
jgi:hypothetical protein